MMCLMFPRLHEALWLDPHPIRDAVDVVEVRGDLDIIGDVAVVEAVAAQRGDLGGTYVPGRAGQALGIFEHGAVGGGQERGVVVGGDLVGQRWVCDLGTEVVRVGLDSIWASV